MFVISLNYKVPIETVEQHLAAHREFLELGYQKEYFIASGPKNPRTGGIILSQLANREQLMEVIKQDPFYLHGIADFEIVEFNPVKYHKNFASFVNHEHSL